MDNHEMIRNQVDVSLKLAKRIFSTEVKGDSNLVFSPLSINVILSVLAAGSNGESRDQLLAFLKSESTEDLNTFYSQIVALPGGPRLSVTNGVWIDQTLDLKSSFKHVVDTVYKIDSNSVDFQHKALEVVDQVNLWVEKETQGLITEILSKNDVNELTRLIFANALYFKGAWADKFTESKTKEREFHLLNGSSIQVPFMSSSMKQCVKAFDGFKVLKLPYKQGKDKRRRFSMYFFLSDAMDGLPSLLDKASSESGFFERHLPNKRVEVGKFRIPKFKISFQFEASSVLEDLGIVAPFNDSGGGLTEMVDQPEGILLYVKFFLHKSFIDVNEEGTEAAAVTLAIPTCGGVMVKEDRVDFVADHPFLFVIREDLSGVILFFGTLLNPHVDSKNSFIKEHTPISKVHSRRKRKRS